MAQTVPARDAGDALPGCWLGFVGGPWLDDVDVRDFIQRNYTPYSGDAGFLAGPTPRTAALWQKVDALARAELNGAYLVDPTTPSRITSLMTRAMSRAAGVS